MLIVPADEPRSVEARILPNEIDQVHIDQVAMLRFTAFNARVTPAVQGIVSRLGANAVQDHKTTSSYYPVQISLPYGEIQGLDRPKTGTGHAGGSIHQNTGPKRTFVSGQAV